MAFFILLLLLLCPALSYAQCPGVTTQLTPFASEKLVISTAVTSLTASIYKPSGVTPSMGMLSIEGGQIRYRVTGTPTTTDGHPIAGTPPTTIIICGLDSLAAFKAVRVDADATVFATYYRPKVP